jgi:hypothetical protein
MFSDAFSRDNQLLKADPKHGLYLACGLMVRGQVEISDIRRNIERSVIVSLVFAVCVCVQAQIKIGRLLLATVSNVS